MVDTLDKAARSIIMSRVRSKDTKPEMIVRRFLHSQGFRYRLHNKALPGKPDIVLPKYETIILIHGCFWHGHTNCRIYVMPKSNEEFWQSKIETNTIRDKKNIKILRALGWKVITIWECDLRKSKRDKRLKRLTNQILKASRQMLNLIVI